MNSILFILFSFITILESFGEFFLRQTAIDTISIYKNYNLYLGFLFYIIVDIIFVFILKIYNNLAIPNVIWQSLNIVFVTFISIFYFGETISNLKIFAIFLVLTGIILLHF